MAELPERFRERMKELLGDEYEAFAASYDKERVQGLRFNGLKTEDGRRVGWEEDGVQAFAAEIAEQAGFRLRKIPWVREGFYYDADCRPGKHPYHEAGLYYIQEPSAMAVVELLDPQPGDLVLDLCAAPGGKSSHIASRLKGRGFLLSNEIHPARAKILSQNMERMGVENCVVSNEDSGSLVPHFTGFFNKMVVDAPCSGEGMFRKDEAAREQWSEEHVRMCAERQAGILDHAAAMLCPGGRLVYSTCTFAPEENEGTILHFLERHSEFSVEKVCAYEGFVQGKVDWAGYNGRGEEDVASARQLHLERTLRIMPQKSEGEGHFMAVLKKDGVDSVGGVEVCGSQGSEYQSRECQNREYQGREYQGREDRNKDRYLTGRKRAELLKEYEDFLKDTMEHPQHFLEREEYVLFGEQLYLLPPQMPELKGLKILRPGLHMGTLKKKRFEPSHGLALALRKEDVKRWIELPSNGMEVVRYLKGETLPLDGWGTAKDPESGKSAEAPKGWGLVLTDGFSLGWCKFAGGMAKNHYPKGLRWM